MSLSPPRCTAIYSAEHIASSPNSRSCSREPIVFFVANSEERSHFGALCEEHAYQWVALYKEGSMYELYGKVVEEQLEKYCKEHYINIMNLE